MEVCVAFALAWLACAGLKASDTSFDSLAFVPDSASGPQARLPDYPALSWSRVAFRPQRTNDFAEELKPVRILESPAGQVTGLAVAGEDLCVVSRATRRVYRLQAKTGAVQGDFACPGEGPAGLCWDGQVLWHADRTNRIVFGFNGTGKITKRFPVTFEPSAVLKVADGLLVSDWAKDEFHRLDPETGRLLGTERAPDSQLTGLTIMGRYLWCSRGEEIIRLDRQRGLPVCGFSAAPARPAPGAMAGLAADGETFWFARPASNQIVQVRVPRHGEWVGGAARVRQTGFEMVYRNSTDQEIEAFTVLQHVPFLEMPGQR